MDELVKALQEILEFFVLGAVGLILLRSAAGAHLWIRVIHASRDFLALLFDDELGRRTAMAISVLGSAFLLGVLADSATYSFFQPTHLEVIHRVRQGAKMRADCPDPAPELRLPLLPFFQLIGRTLPDCREESYWMNTLRQTEWRNSNSESYQLYFPVTGDVMRRVVCHRA